MKQLTLILLTLIFSHICIASPDDFIITIKTNGYGQSNFKQFTIPTNPSETYNYAVDCENDGVVDATNITGDYTCEYGEFGQYTIRIIHDVDTGLGFPSIKFRHEQGQPHRDYDKLISIDQWGTGIWTNMEYAFWQTRYLYVAATDNPDFSQVTSMQSMFFNSQMENLNPSNWDVSNVTNMGSMFGFETNFLSPKSFNETAELSQWDTSSVTNMSGMFYGRGWLPGIENWDTSSVTGMAQMFGGRLVPDISQWDTSSVTNMSGLFADVINVPDISQWNTSSVINMRSLFYGVENLTIDLSNWDTSSVTNMNSLFGGVKDSVINVSNWNTSSVTNIDFIFANIENSEVLATHWDLSQVTDTTLVFLNAKDSIIDANHWNISNLTSLRSLFWMARNLEIMANHWDPSSVISMREMFKNATNITLSADNWDTSSVTSMEEMFRGAELISIDTSQWDTSSVATMKNMFGFARSIQLDTTAWDLSSLQNLAQFTHGSSGIEIDIGNWILPNIINMRLALNNQNFSAEQYDDFLTNLAQFSLNNSVELDISFSQYCSQEAENARALLLDNGWSINDAGKYCPDSSSDYFTFTISGDSFDILTNPQYNYNYSVDCDNDGINEADNLSGNYTCDYSIADTHIIVIKHDTSTGLGFPAFRFGQNSTNGNKVRLINHWGTSKWQSMENAFYNVNVVKWAHQDTPDFSQVTSFHGMFKDNLSIGATDTSDWDTSSANDMSAMFENTRISPINVSNWDTSSVIDMSNMFKKTRVLSLDASSWDTSMVSDMSYMFQESLIQEINTRGWNTSSVTDMSYMFLESCLYSLDANHWNTSSVEDMAGLFNRIGYSGDGLCSEGHRLDKLDIQKWNTSNVTDMTGLFNNVKFQDVNLNSWDTSSVSSMGFMFFNSEITNLNINDWDVSNVSYMAGMFRDAEIPNLNINAWDTASVERMDTMFSSADIDDLNFGYLEIPQVTDMTSMFTDSQINFITGSQATLIDDYDQLLVDFAQQSVQQHVNFKAQGYHYCSQPAVQARERLVTDENWIIDDGGFYCGQHFIMTVKTDNTGVSSDTQFIIGVNPIETGHNYAVDCNNDGYIDSDMIVGNYTCQYSQPGVYEIRIVHDLNQDSHFPSIQFDNSGDELKLLSIENWGDNPWINLDRAFSGAVNMTINAEDLPDLTLIQNMTDTFAGVTLSIQAYDALLVHMQQTVEIINLDFSAGFSTLCSPAARAAKRHLLKNLG